MRHRLLFAALLALTLWLPWIPRTAAAAPPAQSATCNFFTETGGGRGGYAVCDDAQARFRTAFERWGLQKIGYPISQRYTRDGFVTQAFQKAIMQWRPDSGTVVLVNIFDDLHAGGFDSTLLEKRQTPTQFPAGWDGSLSFTQVVQKRQALLNPRPALRATYLAAGDPLTFYGLPTSAVEDMGNHYAIRLQRAVLQEWKEEVPWARAGEVTIANGGDIARELGALPATALVPQSTPPAAASAPPAAERVGNPVRLRIPRIGVNTVIESVGLDSKGRVDVPQGIMNVSWYNRGARPGQTGNAIMAGHLDDFRGDPAVFWRLGELQIGDEIVVEDEFGTARRFKVTDMARYAFDDPEPMGRIYGGTFRTNLNLITCEGNWDNRSRNYDQRLVVYTELVR